MPGKNTPTTFVKGRSLTLLILLPALLSCLALPEQYVKWILPAVSANAKLSRAKTRNEGLSELVLPEAGSEVEALTTCSNLVTVSTTADSGTGSIRAAMSSVCAGGTIIFDQSLTSNGPATITLLTALPDITSSVTITGPGSNFLTVQRSAVAGTPDFRIFSIRSGVTATI